MNALFFDVRFPHEQASNIAAHMSFHQYGDDPNSEEEESQQETQTNRTTTSAKELKRKNLLNKLSRSVNSWVKLINELEIPSNLLNESDGIVIVQAFKVGIIASLSYGNGVLIAKNRRSCKPC
jgi:lipid-binding SYLF domain-containing protein